MPRKTYTPEQIILKLREAEVHIVEGMTTCNAARQIGVLSRPITDGVKNLEA